ncbi:MAG: VWA domain-containing protein, partial [Candidatus Acidiferrales bacterium]
MSTSINTVLVPVVVTDKQGNHLKGLTRDQFEIKEDGKVQQVLSFQEMIAESKPIERANSMPYTFSNKVLSDSPKNMQIIAMDLINTIFTNQAEARAGVLKFLEKSVSEDSLIALVVFYPNGVHLVHNFTSDRSVLADAIKKLQGRPTSRDVGMEGSEVDAEAAMIDAFINGANANGLITGNGNANAQIGMTRAAAGAAQIDAQNQSREGLMTLECMQQVAQYFSSVPGRKSLVWASSGFRFSANAIGTLTGKGATAEEWQRTVRNLQDANIAVYPVDVSGLIGTINATKAADTFSKSVANNLATANSSGEGGVAARSMAMEGYEAGMTQDPIQAKHDTMRNVASWTGGEPFYNSNDLESLFRRASQDSSQYYLLTYSTSDR